MATACRAEYLNADTRSRALRINYAIPMDQIQDRDVDPTQPNEALSRLVSRTSPNLERILIIILIVALLGGFTGVVGGYGYGFGHGGVGVLGTVLIIVLILVLLGRL